MTTRARLAESRMPVSRELRRARSVGFRGWAISPRKRRDSGETTTMPDISQKGRQGQLFTPLGDDVLALVGFDGIEALSELFEYRIEALSEQEGLDFDRALGRN